MKFDAETFSDIYKEAYGIRPHFDLSEYTEQELDELYTRTVKAAELAFEMDRQFEEQSKIEFEKEIEVCIKLGAASRGDAIRWLYDSFIEDQRKRWDEEDVIHDFEWFGESRNLSQADINKYQEEMNNA